jgi:phage terminase small subunit
VQKPNWLDPTAAGFWQKHKARLERLGLLNDQTSETFAVCCQTYSDYRNADDAQKRKTYLDYYLKFAKAFQLVPPRKQPDKIAPDLAELNELFAK